ncbi:hypothetical protein CEXT_408341 [Caerostris extrusa]|uniref:Uncharacterized protein n=1 Tax=Caerostris extrusa TaxID=172846 RepID=A0AAV4SBZ9_CAEEX|nr:hypothetical protein CEXT_408341 [Caerostris extrusa]
MSDERKLKLQTYFLPQEKQLIRVIRGGAYQKKADPAQCFNCQQFYHHLKFCSRDTSPHTAKGCPKAQGGTTLLCSLPRQSYFQHLEMPS